MAAQSNDFNPTSAHRSISAIGRTLVDIDRERHGWKADERTNLSLPHLGQDIKTVSTSLNSDASHEDVQHALQSSLRIATTAALQARDYNYSNKGKGQIRDDPQSLSDLGNTFSAAHQLYRSQLEQNPELVRSAMRPLVEPELRRQGIEVTDENIDKEGANILHYARKDYTTRAELLSRVHDDRYTPNRVRLNIPVIPNFETGELTSQPEHEVPTTASEPSTDTRTVTPEGEVASTFSKATSESEPVELKELTPQESASDSPVSKSSESEISIPKPEAPTFTSMSTHGADNPPEVVPELIPATKPVELKSIPQEVSPPPTSSSEKRVSITLDEWKSRLQGNHPVSQKNETSSSEATAVVAPDTTQPAITPIPSVQHASVGDTQPASPSTTSQSSDESIHTRKTGNQAVPTDAAKQVSTTRQVPRRNRPITVNRASKPIIPKAPATSPFPPAKTVLGKSPFRKIINRVGTGAGLFLAAGYLGSKGLEKLVKQPDQKNEHTSSQGGHGNNSNGSDPIYEGYIRWKYVLAKFPEIGQFLEFEKFAQWIQQNPDEEHPYWHQPFVPADWNDRALYYEYLDRKPEENSEGKGNENKKEEKTTHSSEPYLFYGFYEPEGAASAPKVELKQVASARSSARVSSFAPIIGGNQGTGGPPPDGGRNSSGPNAVNRMANAASKAKNAFNKAQKAYKIGGFIVANFEWIGPLLLILLIIVVVIAFLLLIIGGGEGTTTNGATVSITKSVDKTEIPNPAPTPGSESELNYTLSVQYTGTAQGVIVTDQLPPEVEFLNAGGPGNPTYDDKTRTVTWNIVLSGGAGGTSGAGCYKVSDPPGSDWVTVNSRDQIITEKVKEVEQAVGPCVPVNLVKSLIYTESGGEMLAVNGAGYGGIMQVGVGSWCDHNKYDINTLDGNVGCGVEHLAHTYIECGNSWEGAVTSYYAGHCIPNGAADDPSQGGSGMTDYQYTQGIIDRWKQLDAM